MEARSGQCSVAVLPQAVLHRGCPCLPTAWPSPAMDIIMVSQRQKADWCVRCALQSAEGRLELASFEVGACMSGGSRMILICPPIFKKLLKGWCT